MVPWLIVTCSLVVGLSIGVSLVAYARAVGGVYGLSLLCPGCGLLLFSWCACLPVCGVWFVVCPFFFFAKYLLSLWLNIYILHIFWPI